MNNYPLPSRPAPQRFSSPARLPLSKMLAAAVVVSAVLLPLRARAASFDSLYVFGDSLSDVGNIYNFDGQIYPQSPPYDQGRFSNGSLWVEDLGQKLGLNPTPYYQVVAGATPTQGINFAFGGSSSGYDNAVLPGRGIPGLLSQVGIFTQSQQQADPNGLYAVWAGADDYLSGGNTDPSKTVNNLSTAISDLAGVGAKNILVLNLTDLGKVPATINTPSSQSLSRYTQENNQELNQSINNLRQTFGSSVDITSVDVYSLFNQIINNPKKYGFTDVKDACLTTTSICSDPNQYLFWDSYHPTAAAHQLVADLTYSDLQAQPVPEPSAEAGILILGVVGTFSWLKGQQKKAS